MLAPWLNRFDSGTYLAGNFHRRGSRDPLPDLRTFKFLGALSNLNLNVYSSSGHLPISFIAKSQARKKRKTMAKRQEDDDDADEGDGYSE
jgi:hypothetical protein